MNVAEKVPSSPSLSPSPKAPIVDLTLRFLKSLPTTVSDLRAIIRDAALQPSVPSKLLAAIEYVFVKMLQSGYNYPLADDEGWPVPKIYDRIPRQYIYKGHTFGVTILKDHRDVYYIFLKCNEVSFCLFEIATYAVPLFFHEGIDADVEKYELIRDKLVAYLRLFAPNKHPIFVGDFERALIQTKIVTLVELKDDYHVREYDGYRLMSHKDPALNLMNKLYRTIIYLLHCSNIIVPGNAEIWSANLILNYEGTNFRILHRGTYFSLCLVPGLVEFFLVVRDNTDKFLRSYRIPNKVIPTFVSDRLSIYNDMYRFQQIGEFLHFTLAEARNLTRAAVEIVTTSSSDSINQREAAEEESDEEENFIYIH